MEHQDKLEKSAWLMVAQWGYSHSCVVSSFMPITYASVQHPHPVYWIELLLSHFRLPQDIEPTLWIPQLTRIQNSEHAQLNCSLYLPLVLQETIKFQVIISFQMSWSSPIQTIITFSSCQCFGCLSPIQECKIRGVAKCQWSDNCLHGYHAVLDTWFGKGLG